MLFRSLEGKERFKAPLFTDLNAVGFAVTGETNFLLSELFEFLTDESNDKLIYI